MFETVLLLPAPKAVKRPCGMCEGRGRAFLSKTTMPRHCPSCAGSGSLADTALTVGGMAQRARELGFPAAWALSQDAADQQPPE